MFNAKSIVENFSNNHSLDGLIKRFRELSYHVRADDSLRSFYADANEFIERSLLDPAYIQNGSYEEDARKLLERGRSLVNSEKYKSDVEGVLEEVDSLWHDVRSDGLLRRYARNWNDLMADLFLDSDGNPTLKPELFYDFRAIAPLLVHAFASVEVPRVEASEDDVDYVVDNVKVELEELDDMKGLKGRYKVVSIGEFDMSRVGSHLLSVTFSGLQFTLRDILFWYRKKSGLIQMR